MPRYEIKQYELHTMCYEVEADSEAEAIQKLFDGEGEAVNFSLEFVETCDDLGLPVDVNRELAEQLERLGVSTVAGIIPSIAGIEEINE